MHSINLNNVSDLGTWHWWVCISKLRVWISRTHSYYCSV